MGIKKKRSKFPIPKPILKTNIEKKQKLNIVVFSLDLKMMCTRVHGTPADD